MIGNVGSGVAAATVGTAGGGGASAAAEAPKEEEKEEKKEESEEESDDDMGFGEDVCYLASCFNPVIFQDCLTKITVTSWNILLCVHFLNVNCISHNNYCCCYYYYNVF